MSSTSNPQVRSSPSEHVTQVQTCPPHPEHPGSSEPPRQLRRLCRRHVLLPNASCGQVTPYQDRGDTVAHIFPCSQGRGPRPFPWQAPCRRSVFGERRALIPSAPSTRWNRSPDAVPVASPSFGFSVYTKGNGDRIIFNCEIEGLRGLTM